MTTNEPTDESAYRPGHGARLVEAGHRLGILIPLLRPVTDLQMLVRAREADHTDDFEAWELELAEQSLQIKGRRCCPLGHRSAD